MPNKADEELPSPPSDGAALRPSPPPISHNPRSMVSSSKLCHAASAPNTGAPALPLDALFEVLLRVPAKDLCRLRAVCRSWHALTSDPHFTAQHKARHAEPLFVLTFRDGDVRGVAIVSLSGQILKRIRFASDRIVLLLTHLDRLCAFWWCKPWLAAWVLNPGTGVAIALPGLHSEEFVGTCIERRFHNSNTVTYAFGQAASTGDYKVLRISHPDCPESQLCDTDIITLDGSSQGRWRRKQNPPSGLEISEIMEPLALSGVVYFFFDYAVMEPASMAPFNLDTEKGMPTLQGPEPLRSAVWNFEREISLANLNGSLVIIDNDVGVSFDLWFLMDHKRGLWVKKYRISVEQEQHYCYYARPLLILDDGRIVIFEMGHRFLQCYDPRTGNLADMLDIRAMGLGESSSIGVYTGSLLI